MCGAGPCSQLGCPGTTARNPGVKSHPIAEIAESPTSPNIGCALRACSLSRALHSLARPALSRLSRAPARACARGVCLVLSGPVLRALLRCLERIAAGTHDGYEPERRHEDAPRRHRRFWCAQAPSIRPYSHRMPLTQLVIAGGAFVGTLATHALAPAPALKESFVAAEKMEPAFKV